MPEADRSEVSTDSGLPVPSLKDAVPVWTKIGLLSFGGPAGQIALMQDEVVTRRGWIRGESFDRGLAFSMMLPGPEAQQLATWLGWKLHGVIGGLIAGLAFIVPGAALMITLAWLAAAKGDVPIIAAIFAGVQPVAIALVIAAMRKIAGRAIKQPAHWALAVAAFVALSWLGVPFPLVIAAAALVGVLLPGEDSKALTQDGPPILRHAAITLILAAAFVGAVYLFTRSTYGADPYDDVAVLFTTAALVTFGGAYAVLPFVADQAVEAYGWLDAAAMLNGLAIAEATPGPLILVNTYAGFFAGWSNSFSASAGVHTAILATIYTFGPSFALILAFAPAVERLQDIPWARRALAGISAAVVGVIAKLVIYLAEAAFIPNGFADAEWGKLVILVIALVLVFVFRLGMLALVGFGICAGLALYALGLT
ncbi:MAG: chromate efflux transporter [Pseudomonadota bacterium]